MGGIIEFFQAIADGVVAAVQYLGDLLSDIAYMITLVTTFIAKIPAYFSWLPSAVSALIISAFSIVIIYKILGREG